MLYTDLIEFEWNDGKAESNFRKHGVRFSEAATIWLDEAAREIHDPDHSECYSKRAKAIFGEVNFVRDEYDFSGAKKAKKAKEVKVVKTFRLDPDVIAWLESEGEKQGMGYQTFLNWFLRNSMKGRPALEERLARLERAVFKKRA